MSQQILFDLDDTLIYCNRYFFRTIDRFAHQLVNRFNDPSVTLDAVKAKQSEFDSELIGQSGFKSEHFPQSFIETYVHFADLLGVAVSSSEKDSLWKLGMEVYAHETEPYPYMEETLQQLQHQGHELHLYTGGEHSIQLRKIHDMDLKRYFDDRIYIRQVKNISALDELLTEHAFERSRTWMIGNSIRNDIVPALHAGIHAIHVEVPDEWNYNIIQVDVKPKGQYFSVQSLQQIPSTFVPAI
ncbi:MULTISPECIES: HAD family hydrolase [Paenibacillus]|uniref:HAD family hydrolase n=1 Tax=Paenibacillus TaxID=44249 RepID=UPI002040967D|nr:HAD family hydrolase [Paenibacillus camelliae]MCM3631756.1 HAD family hydrolase [Paenibacillus camelliae]